MISETECGFLDSIADAPDDFEHSQQRHQWFAERGIQTSPPLDAIQNSVQN